MRLGKPVRYRLYFDSHIFRVVYPQGTPRFSGAATSRMPKLYIVSVDSRPIYVGITKQPMCNRLRFGWSANGKSGYYGYRWRHRLTEADLDVWCQEDAAAGEPLQALETVEAEVVYLIRAAGQWPEHQTEIHFHPSNEHHRELAHAIIAHFDKHSPAPQRVRGGIR